MAGSIDDFMQRFGGQGSVSDADVAQAHDRFISDHPDDWDFDQGQYHQAAVEHLGQIPDDQFQQAAASAFSNADPNQRQGLLSTVLGGLGGGSALGGLAGMLGLGSSNPNQMSPTDYGKVLNYARRQNPEVVQQTVQQQPGFMKALGNPIVMGALTMLATKMLKNHFGSR